MTDEQFELLVNSINGVAKALGVIGTAIAGGLVLIAILCK